MAIATKSKMDIRSILLILGSLPLMLLFIYRWVDYNMYIQIPYWSLFSFCYLMPDSELSICTPESIDRVIAWTANNFRWELESLKPNEYYSIPEMQAKDFNYGKLDQMTKGFTVPVVVRGLFNGSAATTKWTHEYFEERFGDNILVTLSEGRTDRQYESSEQFTKITGKGYGYQNIMRPYKMKVKNALKHMREGEKLYISNVDTIFRRNNDLLDDLEFSTRIKPWAYDPYTPYAAQIFLGYGSKDPKETTGTMFHCAASANLFVQAQGTKHWIFVSPRYAVFLNPSLGRITPAAKARTRPVNVPFWKVDLHQGDVLLNPPWMWHEIKNAEGFNIGVATRENHPPWIVRNNALFSLLLEWRATPRVAKNMIPPEKKVLRVLASIPFLTFSMVYILETFKGPLPSALFTAAYNPCDEHDPNSCTTTILDRTVYSDDVNEIPYRE